MVQPAEASRRRYVRLPVLLPASGWMTDPQSAKVQGTVRNVSAGGILAEFPREMPPGRSVRVVLSSRQGLLEVEGTVVWVRGVGLGIHHGIAFPEPKNRRFALDLFLAEHR